MEIPPIVMLMIAQDDEDELTMYETYLFNTIHSRVNNGASKGLPVRNPQDPCRRTSNIILTEMHMGHTLHDHQTWGNVLYII